MHRTVVDNGNYSKALLAYTIDYYLDQTKSQFCICLRLCVFFPQQPVAVEEKKEKKKPRPRPAAAGASNIQLSGVSPAHRTKNVRTASLFRMNSHCQRSHIV